VDTTPILYLGGIIFLILLAVGIFVATLTYWQRGQAKKREETRPQPKPVSEALSPAVESPGVAQTPASPGEVMRVIRDEKMGRVLVEVKGARYAHIREIQDPQVGRRVLWAIADLVRFTGGMATDAKTVRSVAQTEGETQSQPALQQTAQPAMVPTNRDRTSSMSLSSLASSAATQGQKQERPASPVENRSPSPPPPVPILPAEEAETAPQRYNIGAFFRRAFEPVQPTEPLPGPTAFVDEIEEILQDKIRARQTPLRHDVHVQAAENGSLLIRVDQEVYDSLERVPQPEIEALIRSAVAEWEST